MLLQHGISAQAEANPDATALVFQGTRTSYRQLERDSNRLAHVLVESSCQPQDRVAILMPKMPTAIVAMLGALKADCCYVPMDPADPPARLARTLEVADCRCVLTVSSVGPTLRQMLAIANLQQEPIILWMDNEAAAMVSTAGELTQSDMETVPVVPLPRDSGVDRIAQILFTSGSTGAPKGVMISHANVLHFIRWASAYFRIRGTDRISQHSSLRFDISTFDIFGALWAGAELHLVPRELNLLPHKLAEFIRDHRLTQWFSVPSVLNLMARFDVIGENDFPSLRRVLFAGEVLPTPTLMHWMHRLPHVQFTNLYGPTETTISSSFYTIPTCPTDARQRIPIGTACAGEDLLLLDNQRQAVTEPGVEADLYIKGPGVTLGYWRDAEKTSKAFLPYGGGTIYRTGDRACRDEQGLFYYLGRSDSQIKSRGYRIELGEIESALHSIDELSESAVVAIESDGFEGILLCCAYVIKPDATLTLAMLRERLSGEVPAYMIPARWACFELLPRNMSDKVDRRFIADHFRCREATDRTVSMKAATAG